MRQVRGLRGVLIALLVLGLAGCGGNQNTLAPASPQEHRISILFWIMMTGAWIGFGILIGLLTMGWLRRRRGGLPFGGGERAGNALVIVLGVVTPIIVLAALFVYADIFVVNTTAAPPPGTTSRTIEVIGKQWFWEARYPGTKAVTANEIHIPARTRVNVLGRTADVIHSFWVPELNRKIDVIPGRTNRVLLQANHSGAYRGECAEFCGLQHAHMSLIVYADPPARFRSWLAHEASPARPPSSTEERRGQRLFLSKACAGCHTIRGTDAHGNVGPDLTHVGSRHALAGLVIGNSPQDMLRWIHNPQAVKTGVKMPDLHLSAQDLSSIVAYLQGLQ